MSVSCSPSAIYTLNSGTAIGSSSNGNALFTYNPTITPVTINLTGPLIDTSGNFITPTASQTANKITQPSSNNGKSGLAVA